MNILDGLKTVVQSTIKTESINAMRTYVELLRQIFSDVDQCGLKLKIDISSLENE